MANGNSLLNGKGLFRNGQAATELIEWTYHWWFRCRYSLGGFLAEFELQGIVIVRGFRHF